MLKKIFIIMIFFGLNLYSPVYRRYEYKCITTGKIIKEWRDEAPTVCLENPAHTLDLTTLKVIDVKEVNDIITTSDQGATQGIYKSTTFVVDVTNPTADSITTADYSFPYPIKALSVSLTPGTANIGDKVSLIVASNTPCWAVVGNPALGKITQAVNVSDTVLTVDKGVIAAIQVGHKVTLQNGSTTEDLGRCTAINNINGTITVENAATQSFAANTTNVLFSIIKFENIEIFGAYKIDLGTTITGGSYIPANVVGRIFYKNVSGGTKRFGIILEWLE